LLYLMFKDDIKVRCIIAIIAPIGGALSFGMLIFYNSRF
jgi:hypothetical protein